MVGSFLASLDQLRTCCSLGGKSRANLGIEQMGFTRLNHMEGLSNVCCYDKQNLWQTKNEGLSWNLGSLDLCMCH